MNTKTKKIIKNVVICAVTSGVAFAAYKLGEKSGEINEKFRKKYEDDYLYDDMDEPDDGCISPAYKNDNEDYENVIANGLPFLEHEIYEKLLKLFENVIHGDAKMARYYNKTTDDWIEVHRVGRNILFISLDDGVFLNNDYFLMFNVESKTAKAVEDSTFYSGISNAFEQYSSDYRVDGFLCKLINSELILKEYINADGAKIFERKEREDDTDYR